MEGREGGTRLTGRSKLQNEVDWLTYNNSTTSGIICLASAQHGLGMLVTYVASRVYILLRRRGHGLSTLSQGCIYSFVEEGMDYLPSVKRVYTPS